jgi:hypothetical protein
LPSTFPGRIRHPIWVSSVLCTHPSTKASSLALDYFADESVPSVRLWASRGLASGTWQRPGTLKGASECLLNE